MLLVRIFLWKVDFQQYNKVDEFIRTKVIIGEFKFDYFIGPQGQYQTILRKVSLPIVDYNSCQTRLRATRLGESFQLHSSFICAGGQPNMDTCYKDGGGPLVCQDSSGRFIQVSLTTFLLFFITFVIFLHYLIVDEFYSSGWNCLLGYWMWLSYSSSLCQCGTT